MEKKTLVIADLDGTLTKKDTFLEFIRFTHGSFKLYLGFLLNLPYIFFYILKIYSNENLKIRMLKYFYKNFKTADMVKMGKKFADEKLPVLIYKGADKMLSEHKLKGHEIVILTASCNFWLKIWAEKHHFRLIATEIDESADYFTGFLTPNCHSEEKVIRLKEKYNLEDYDQIIAYGNEKSDLPFMNLAHQQYFKPFKM